MGPSPNRLSAVSLDHSDASVVTTPPIVAILKRPQRTGLAAADPVSPLPPINSYESGGRLPLVADPYEVPFQGLVPSPECDRRSNALSRASTSVSSARFRAMEAELLAAREREAELMKLVHAARSAFVGSAHSEPNAEDSHASATNNGQDSRLP